MTTSDSNRHTGRWTIQRIHDLGVVTDIPTAAAIIGISRSLAYQLAHDDRFPLPVIRAGQRYLVPVAAILDALHLPRPRTASSPATATATAGPPPSEFPGSTTDAERCTIPTRRPPATTSPTATVVG
jgi:hypothetical protein